MTIKDCRYLLGDIGTGALLRLNGGCRQVGGRDYLFTLQEDIVPGRFLAENINRRPTQAALFERLVERLFIHDTAPGAVNNHCGRLHQFELVPAD